MLKKGIAMILALVMLCGMSACKKDEENTIKTDEREPIRIGNTIGRIPADYFDED